MRYLIAICGVLIIVLRIFFPTIIFDSTSLSIFIVIVLTLLFPEVSKFLSKVKKIKAGGFELEIDTLTRETENAEANMELINVPENLTLENDLALNYSDFNQDNPQVSLINIAIEIEKILNSLAEGLYNNNEKIPFSRLKLMDLLVKEGIIDNQLRIIFKDFWLIRNKVIHGHSLNVSNQELYRIIDLGIKLLNLLRNEKNKLIVNNSLQFQKIVEEVMQELKLNFKSQQKGKDIHFDYYLTDSVGKNHIIEIKYWNIKLDKSVINQILRIIEVSKTDVILICNKELRNETYEYLQLKQKQIQNKIIVIVGQTKETLKNQMILLLK